MIINQVTLQGNLGKDAETKYTADGKPVTTISLATQSTSGKHTDWHGIVSFGPLAEDMKALRKGNLVRVEGELRSHEYTLDTETTKRTGWEIRAQSFEITRQSRRETAATATALLAATEPPR